MISGVLSGVNYTIISGRVPLKLSVGDFAIAFLVFLYTFIVRKKIYYAIRGNSSLFMLGLLFITLSLVTSILYNDLWLVSIKFCIKICLLFSVLVYMYQVSIVTKNTLAALCFIVIFLNIIGLVEFFAPERLKGFLLLLKDQENLVMLKHTRVGSLLINPNIFGVFNAMIILVIMHLCYGGRVYINNYLYGSTLLCSAVGVILSGSMNAGLTLFIGIIILLYVTASENKVAFKKILLGCVVLSMLVFGAIKHNGSFASSVGRDFPFATKVYTKQPINITDLIPTFHSHERVVIWKEGFQQFKEHPIFGVGANQFVFRNRVMPGFHMHNIFGEILVNHGLTGFSIFIVLIGIWFLHAKSLWQVGLVITILISHMLDCFVTHSIVWVIFVPWLIVITTKNTDEMFVSAQSNPVTDNS